MTCSVTTCVPKWKKSYLGPKIGNFHIVIAFQSLLMILLILKKEIYGLKRSFSLFIKMIPEDQLLQR